MNISALPQNLRWSSLPDLKSHYEWTTYLEKNEGFSYRNVPGRIGSGKAIHRLLCLSRFIGDDMQVASVRSLCGSQKWVHGHSRVVLVKDDIAVNCKRSK